MSTVASSKKSPAQSVAQSEQPATKTPNEFFLAKLAHKFTEKQIEVFKSIYKSSRRVSLDINPFLDDPELRSRLKLKDVTPRTKLETDEYRTWVLYLDLRLPESKQYKHVLANLYTKQQPRLEQPGFGSFYTFYPVLNDLMFNAYAKNTFQPVTEADIDALAGANLQALQQGNPLYLELYQRCRSLQEQMFADYFALHAQVSPLAKSKQKHIRSQDPASLIIDEFANQVGFLGSLHRGLGRGSYIVSDEEFSQVLHFIRSFITLLTPEAKNAEFLKSQYFSTNKKRMSITHVTSAFQNACSLYQIDPNAPNSFVKIASYICADALAFYSKHHAENYESVEEIYESMIQDSHAAITEMSDLGQTILQSFKLDPGMCEDEEDEDAEDEEYFDDEALKFDDEALEE